MLWVIKWAPLSLMCHDRGFGSKSRSFGLTPSMTSIHLRSQVESFLFIQNHWPLLSAVLEYLTAWVFPRTPIFWTSLDSGVAPNPLQPSSAIRIFAFQPRYCASAARSAYLKILSSYLASHLCQKSFIPGHCKLDDVEGKVIACFRSRVQRNSLRLQ